MADGDVTMGGDNSSSVAFKSKKGSVNKDKWYRRYEELVSAHMMCMQIV